jgi:hypothetical protein
MRRPRSGHRAGVLDGGFLVVVTVGPLLGPTTPADGPTDYWTTPTSLPPTVSPVARAKPELGIGRRPANLINSRGGDLLGHQRGTTT